MRPHLTVLAFLTLLPGLAPRDLAGQDECNEARAKFLAADEEVRKFTRPMWEYEDRLFKQQEEAKSNYQVLRDLRTRRDLLSELLGDPALNPDGMRRFADQVRLPNDVRALIAANRPEEFWRRAEIETRTRRREAAERPLTPEMRAAIENRRKLDVALLQCEQRRTAAPPPTEGPLPVERNQSGQPIITDALLTRWFRGYHAMQSGGAYWRAGHMTQQEFDEVNKRVAAFTVAACRPEGKAREGGAREWICQIDPVRTTLENGFAAEELAVFQARQSEMGAALSGNWSAVRM